MIQIHREDHHGNPPDGQRAETAELQCGESVELLPWLVNGSLEAGEHRQLRDHVASCEACRSELAETLEAARIFSRHVPSLALVEYSQGLEPAELGRDLIESHLASCPSCQDDLRLIRTEGDHNVLDFADALRRRERPVRYRPSRRRLALAAVLSAATLAGLVWGVLSSRPQPGPSARELAAYSTVEDLAPGAPVSDHELQGRASRLLIDGFESATASAWSETTDFFDGFETGDISTWSKSAG